ncbi:hypothetical protein BB561_005918 [Smittium simulii]|uniref:Translation initiation factor eIF2B subunit epsilon n=1 Tax=Smittium simulii TaxID=133385 RepID=A0A2T9Y7N1_9FUNG|nr:hypothetical protein BB561_005918 [Smittium simulii]
MREIEPDQILQAVIIAEAFDDNFKPLTLHTPRCLLPLCNTPMIEYILDFLHVAKVDEVFIFCQSYPEQIQQYLKSSKWSRPGFQMKININIAKEASSIGDFMRILDGQSLIKSDFILCSANFVANLDMEDILDQHFKRKLVDKNEAMTLVLKQADVNHRLRWPSKQQTLFFTSPHDNKLLHVETIDTLDEHFGYDFVSSDSLFPNNQSLLNNNNASSDPSFLEYTNKLGNKQDTKQKSKSRNKQKKFEIPKEIFKENSEICANYCLVDSYLAICAPNVLSLFAENFDYQTIIEDFVRGILTSDLLSSTVYAHIISNNSSFTGKGSYSSGILGTGSYSTVAWDIISRWAYPVCPNKVLSLPSSSLNEVSNMAYNYRRGNIYVGKNVKLARKCLIGARSILGYGTVVQDYAKISDSVTGNNCLISEHSTIKDSHIFNDVSVGPNSKIYSSIIGKNVKILDNVTIERGCIIGDNVVLGPSVTLKPFTKIYLPSTTSTNKSDSGLTVDHSLVGAKGSGYLWEDSVADDNEWDTVCDDPKYKLFDHIGVLPLDLAYAKYSQQSQANDHSLNFNNEYDLSQDENDRETADSNPLNVKFSDFAISSNRGYFVKVDSSESSGSSISDSDDFKEDFDNMSDAEERIEAAKHNMDKKIQEDFKNEVIATMLRAIEENHTVQTASLELNTLRMAYDGNLDYMRKTVIECILNSVKLNNTQKPTDLKVLQLETKKVISKWAQLISKNIYSSDDYADTINIVFNHTTELPKTSPFCAQLFSNSVPSDFEQILSKLFMFIVRFLYEFDVVEGDALIDWYNLQLENDFDVMSPLEQSAINGLSKFIEWLDESDEDESEDDESD